MFGSDLLGIIIGMIFFYLLLSLICSVMSEMVAGMFAWRAGTTYKGLRDFFFDPKGANLINTVYEHPLVQGLKRPGWWDSIARFGTAGAGRPNEIPLENFRDALRDTVESHPPIDPNTQRVVKKALSDDQEKVQQWWGGAVQTLHDRFRAKIQWLIVFVALIVAGVANADTFMWFNALRSDSTVRVGVMTAISEVARKADPDTPQVAEALDTLQERLPELEIFGWSTNPGDRRAMPANVGDWVIKVMGLFITTVVIARTAPYAFDFFRAAIHILSRRASLQDRFTS